MTLDGAPNFPSTAAEAVSRLITRLAFGAQGGVSVRASEVGAG